MEGQYLWYASAIWGTLAGFLVVGVPNTIAIVAYPPRTAPLFLTLTLGFSYQISYGFVVTSGHVWFVFTVYCSTKPRVLAIMHNY